MTTARSSGIPSRISLRQPSIIFYMDAPGIREELPKYGGHSASPV
jgi:hypothetical protein